MPSRNTYRFTWVSLTLDVGYLFMAAPAKHSHCSLPWTTGISSLAAPPDLEHGVAPLGPPEPVQPLISDSFKTKNLTLFRNQALGTISKGSNIAVFYSIVTRVWRVSKRF